MPKNRIVFQQDALLLFDSTQEDDNRFKGQTILDTLIKEESSSKEPYFGLLYLQDACNSNVSLHYLKAGKLGTYKAEIDLNLSSLDCFVSLRLLGFLKSLELEKESRLAPGEDWHRYL